MKTLICFLGVSLLILGSFPSLISTHLGNEFCAYTFEKWTGNHLKIKELSIGWFDMQKIEGLDFQGDSFDLKIDRLTSHNSLFEILFKGGDLGKTLIYSPDLTIKGSSKKKASFPLLPYAGDIYIENGSLTTPHVQVSHLNLELGIPINRSLIAFKASGQTHHNTLSGAFDLKGTIYPNLHENSSLQVHLQDFPLETLDKMVALVRPEYSGLILTSLGESMNLQIEASYTKTHLGVAFALKTPLMNGGFHLKYQDGAITLGEQGTLNWSLKKEVYPYFDLPFQEDIALRLNFNSLLLPFDATYLNWKDIQAEGNITSVPFTLQFKTQALNKALSLNLKSLPLNGELTLTELIHPTSLELHAKRLPLTLFNRSGVLESLLGRMGDFDITLYDNLLTLQADSEYLHIPKTSIEWKGDQFQLQAPTLLSLKEYSATLNQFSGTWSHWKAHLDAVQGNEGKLDDVTLSFQWPKFSIEGSDKTGSFSGAFHLKEQTGTLSLHRISTYNLGTLFNASRDLPSLIGPTLSGKITQIDRTFDLKLNSSEISLQGSLYYDPTSEIKGGPLDITWALSDQSYHALCRLLKKEAHNLIEIKKTSELKFHIAHFDSSSFKGSFELKDLYLAPDYHLQNLKGSLNKDKILDFDLTGLLRAERQTGYIKLLGKVDQKVELTGEIQNLPTIFLDALPIKMRLSQLFGEKLNVNMKCFLENDQGKLNLSIDASHFKTDIAATLEKGILYLDRSIDIGTQITPELGKFLLGDVGIEVVGAKNPLLVHIDSRGLAIPYKSFQLGKILLPNISIDLGQILIRSSGSAADVNKIFKLQRDPKEPLHLYFAPMVMHVSQGKVSIERTEMLYDGRFDLCTWGEIDLLKEYINLKLGFTAQALYKGFGLSMPPSYVLTIPLKGPYDHVQIDTQAATAKIAGIIARKAGASVGGIWGGLLDAAGGIADDQSKVPPAKHPFPWEKH